MIDYTQNTIALLIGLFLAWIITRTPYVKKISQYLSTLFHEAGHAIAALFLGGKVQGIRLELDGSGLTVSGHQRGLTFIPTRVIVLLSGYSFPVNIGLIVLTLVYLNTSDIYILIFLGVVGILTLFFIRNIIGFLITITYLGLIALGFIVQEVIPLQFSLSFLASILLINGVKDVINITRFNFSSQQRSSEQSNDFTYLKDTTRISYRFWNIFYILLQLVTLPIVVGAITVVNNYYLNR